MSSGCSKRTKGSRSSILCVFVQILLLAASPAEDIVAAYNASLNALRKGDVDAALSIDTDDWVSITIGQKPRTKQELAPYAASAKPPEGWKATFKKEGTTSGIQIYDITQPDPNTAIILCLVGSKRDNVWTGSHVRDTWIKTRQGWKRRKHEKLTVNERIPDTNP